MTDQTALPTDIVDGHVHVWDTSAFPLHWLAQAPHLRARYGSQDLLGAAGADAPRSAVAVQAGTSLAEAQWLLSHAAEAGGFLSGTVLQYLPEPGAWAGVVTPAFDSSPQNPAGVRIPVHRAAADWRDLEGLDVLAAELQRRELVLELLLRPDQLEAAGLVAARHPDLKVVICHLGLGSHTPDDSWYAAVTRLGGRENVAMKLSGIFGAAEDRRSAVSTARDAFGAERLLFGSDWPMSTTIGSYRDVIDRTVAALGPLTSEESDAIWRGTATRLYKLDPTS